jgi:hypothetical protein
MTQGQQAQTPSVTRNRRTGTLEGNARCWVLNGDKR